MKKIILLVLCCLIFTGCTIRNTTETSFSESGTFITAETLPPQIPVEIYLPDENAESFLRIHHSISELDASLIVAILVHENVLNESIVLYSAEKTDNQLNLDFNQAFLDQLRTYGTAGERMMIGCVVNTFLNAYDVETVYITVNGEIMESGHVIYDFPMGYFE